MGRSATGILHFLNQTPIDAFSKRQNYVKYATYRTKFMAPCQAIEQIIDLWSNLRLIIPSSWHHAKPLNRSLTCGTLCACLEQNYVSFKASVLTSAVVSTSH